MKDKKYTHFGFQKVDLEEKAKKVHDVFKSVAGKYDLMNDLMSLGIHRLWKKQFVQLVRSKGVKRILDVGGGTGDIAINFLEQGGEYALVLDVNKSMLEKGKEKAIQNGYITSIEFQEGNAELLDFADNSQEAYTISFCIRNVTDINKALKEAHRVLKKGGRFFCLEFSQIDQPLLAKMYDAWSFKCIPEIGGLITGDKNAYKYLVESIRKFPSQEAFKKMIEEAGFQNVAYKNLNQGIVAIHYGEKK